MSESEYTKSTNPLHKYEEQLTNYNWYEDENLSNMLLLSKQVIKLIKLKLIIFIKYFSYLYYL